MNYIKALPKPWTISGFDAANHDLAAPFAALLQTVCVKPALHARFLNMLSMLEHMGSRKIMLSQMRHTMSPDILKHVAEETRHAYFFKRQACQAGGDRMVDYNADNTLCTGAARFYFGRLDTMIARELPQPHQPEIAYLWVSLIIELRACWTYGLYQEALTDIASPWSLKSILAEENRHMADMYERLVQLDAAPDRYLQRFSDMETGLFRKFFVQLQDQVATAAA